ncbi:hypothetical protein G7054_g9665 [Neopestalotiopsis clavispora]|nr:hypothetical protein G7054_g9665 [Neopestalotiopsis clavispora]
MATDHDPNDTTEDVGGSFPRVSTDCEFLAMLPRHVEIDPLGDKTLIVGTNQCSIDTSGAHEHKRAGSFRVCSRALARSSPVMKAMLFGNFQESRQDIVRLPEDDPDAMEILLHVVHNNPAPASSIHTSLSISQAYEIVALANKYLMTLQLHPWAKPWTCIYTNDRLGSDAHQICREKLLFIAYEFGNTKRYEEILTELARHHTRNRELFSASIEPAGASGKAMKRYLGLRIKLIPFNS